MYFLRLVAIFGLLVTSSLAARRRSRIDLPIQIAADAPIEDNLATASDGSEVIEKFELVSTTVPKEQKVETKAAEKDDADSSEALPGDCKTDNFSFELATGYVFDCITEALHSFDHKTINLHRYVLSSSENILDAVPGTLMLTECLDQCRNNESCSSVNYETGLCVLFSSNADDLPGMDRSQDDSNLEK